MLTIINYNIFKLIVLAIRVDFLGRVSVPTLEIDSNRVRVSISTLEIDSSRLSSRVDSNR